MPTRNWMLTDVEPATLQVEAERPRGRLGEPLLPLDREVALYGLVA